jgi:tetratricopeptide (TPR) repeat protein
MERDVTSFWADINKYEEVLAKDPGSYSFVSLAEIYRKMGLLDEAIHVAKKGCEVHPDYVGGYMALGRAYFDKGMKEESKAALEKVVSFTHDNFLARRILSHIYMERGETAAAETALRFILSHNPADQESQELLESLKVSPAPELSAQSEATAGTATGEFPVFDGQTFDVLPEAEEIIEDAELLEELTDEETSEEEDFIFTPPVDTLKEPEEDLFVEKSDPLVTATMAELYVSQGFLKRALTIYRRLLETEPDNAEWINRLYELKTAIDEDTAMARKVATTDGAAGTETARATGQPEGPVPVDEAISPVTQDDTVLGTLEKWRDTIRRRG